MPEAVSEPRPEIEAAKPLEPVPVRSIVQRARALPLPRKLVALALLFAGLVVVLHLGPRPYGDLPGPQVLFLLGSSFRDIAGAYQAGAGLEPVPGEASLSERSAYRRELWLHEAGVMRELAIRVLEGVALACLTGSLLLLGWRQRRLRRKAREEGARMEPRLLRVETQEGSVPLDPASVGLTAPAPATPPAAAAAPPAPPPTIPAVASPDAYALQPLPPGANPAPDEESGEIKRPENLAERIKDLPPEATQGPKTPRPPVLLHETADHVVVRPSDKKPDAPPEGEAGSGATEPPPPEGKPKG